MRLVPVNELKENQVLARAVLINGYTILLSEGTVLKDIYIEKLKELEISGVYIEDEIGISESSSGSILRKEIEKTVKSKVKDVLEHHLYGSNDELSELSKTADTIITDILSEEEILNRVVEMKQRSADLYEHSVSVCALSTIVALREGFDHASVHDLGVSSLLHDLGLRYMTISYENVNIGNLSDWDAQEFSKHPIYAYSALQNEKWISERSKIIILQHHEYIDGSGYPLKSSNLLPETQILSICDTFDEMICGIGYVSSKVYEAVEYLRVFKQVKFNAKYVDTFLDFTAVYPAGSKVLLSDGTVAIVDHQNAKFPERPVLRPCIGDNNMTQVSDNYIDLMKFPNLVIDKVLNN